MIMASKKSAKKIVSNKKNKITKMNTNLNKVNSNKLKFNKNQIKKTKIFEKILLMDIGGTYTRYLIYDTSKSNFASTKPTSILTQSLQISTIKELQEINKVSKIIIACAGPVIDGKCKMTNANLVFDERTLSLLFAKTVIVINDFVASAYALENEKGCILIGPGTGLGCSIISKNQKIIPSEDGHLKIPRDLYLSIPEFSHVNLPEYEQVIAAKNNLLLKIFSKDKLILSNNGDRLSEIYKIIFTRFIEDVINKHKEHEIKKIVLRGGVVLSNEKFFMSIIKEINKKVKKEIKIVDDDFLGLKGLRVFVKK